MWSRRRAFKSSFQAASTYIRRGRCGDNNGTGHKTPSSERRTSSRHNLASRLRRTVGCFDKVADEVCLRPWSSLFLSARLTRKTTSLLGRLDIPVIPLISADQLPECIDNLRKLLQAGRKEATASTVSQCRDLLSSCVSGPPLSRRQTDCLSEIVGSFRELASGALTPEHRRALYDLLGEEDGNRLLSFWTDGPKPKY